MCGIVGAVAINNVVPVLLDGLQRLEYRGYDSAGLVVTCGGLQRLRTTGRVHELQKLAHEQKMQGFAGIAHTRWATHGAPSVRNAHPHFSRLDENNPRIAVVHNGIVENYESMRERLHAEGYRFVSDTDTEVIAHLVALNLKRSEGLLEAVCASIVELQGAFAIAVMEEARPDKIVVARYGAPLLLGLGESGNYAASDVSALLKATKNLVYLEEGDVAELTSSGYRIVNCRNGKVVQKVERAVHETELTTDAVELGTYAHYMQKEIFEQSSAVQYAGNGFQCKINFAEFVR